MKVVGMGSKKRVIIVGAGFAGIEAAIQMRKANAEILLIDKTNHHVFQPLLYQVAGAALSPRDISMPVREIFCHQDNVSVIMGEVTGIDKANRSITLGNRDRYQYDYLILAVGARHSYFGNDIWEQHAPGLKTISDALTIREKILTSFEIAERCDVISEANTYLTFAIVGGGPTGVELAGTFAEICTRTMRKNFSRISSEKARVILIEGFDRVLPPFPPKLSKQARADLEKMGVEVLTKHKVTKITEEGIETDKGFIATKNVLWAAGNQASPLLQKLEVETDRSGRVFVQKDLSIPGHPEIFVLGDCANFQWKGAALPAVAPAAKQQGKYVGKLLRKETFKEAPLKHRKKLFRYVDKGGLATIGRFKAVGYIKKFRFSGFFAWIIWGGVHIAYLIGYRNRMTVMLEWFLHTFTGKRSSRIIYNSIDEKIPSIHKEKKQ